MLGFYCFCKILLYRMMLTATYFCSLCTPWCGLAAYVWELLGCNYFM